jgi:hypothetical protein
MSHLIQSRPYITETVRQTPTRGQDPSRRHFWMASLIIEYCWGHDRGVLLVQGNRAVRDQTSARLYVRDPSTGRTKMHSMIGGFLLKGEGDLTSINMGSWIRHKTDEYICPLGHVVPPATRNCSV